MYNARGVVGGGGRGEGGQTIYLKGAKFFQIPPHHTEFFDNLPTTRS